MENFVPAGLFWNRVRAYMEDTRFLKPLKELPRRGILEMLLGEERRKTNLYRYAAILKGFFDWYCENLDIIYK